MPASRGVWVVWHTRVCIGVRTSRASAALLARLTRSTMRISLDQAGSYGRYWARTSASPVCRTASEGFRLGPTHQFTHQWGSTGQTDRRENSLVERWARLGSNQRPPACERCADGAWRGLEATVELFSGARRAPDSLSFPGATHQNSPIGGSPLTLFLRVPHAAFVANDRLALSHHHDRGGPAE
jgi:hypothetical protein